MAERRICTFCKKAVKVRYVECKKCGIICHYSCGEKEKVLIGDSLELVCCDLSNDFCDDILAKIDSYKENIAEASIENILEEIFCLRHYMRLKDTIIRSQRETIEVLRESLDRSVADKISYTAVCGETISALKLALSLGGVCDAEISELPKDGTGKTQGLVPRSVTVLGGGAHGLTSLTTRGNCSGERTTADKVPKKNGSGKKTIADGVPNIKPLRSVPAVTAGCSSGDGGPVGPSGRLSEIRRGAATGESRVTGSLASIDCGIRSAPRLTWYYVSRLSVDTETGALSEYIKSDILKSDNLDVEIVELSKHINNKSFKSFRVGVPADCTVNLLDPGYWPLDVTIEPSFRPRSGPRQYTGSRVYFNPTRNRRTTPNK